MSEVDGTRGRPVHDWVPQVRARKEASDLRELCHSAIARGQQSASGGRYHFLIKWYETEAKALEECGVREEYD